MIDIDNLSEEELIDLHNRIAERLNVLEQMKCHVAMMELRIGERVTFSAKDGQRVIGTLTKYNRKTVTVVTEAGQRWNVSPGLVSKAVPHGESSSGGNVVPLKRSD